MVKRFTSPDAQNPQGGLKATHKQDFNAHTSGGDWKHDADHILMNPQLSQFPHPNVQGTLELLGGFSASQGSGFISIGNTSADGYATGSYNVTDSNSFESALNSAFLDDRLVNGGIILILAGTYRMNSTVTVPPGITLMGEDAGTVVIQEGSGSAMFKFQSGETYPKLGGDSGSGELSLDPGSPLDASGLVNLILADNLDGYLTSGGQPISAMPSTPMVQLETGGKLTARHVKFLGRINNGTVAGRNKTQRAIGTISGSGQGTKLTLEECFFDGMETAVRFEPLNGDLDHLVVRNCRARTFGTEDAGAPTEKDNCFIALSLCNLRAENNYHIGYGTSANQLVDACFVVTSASGGTDVDMLVTGTSGGPTSGFETSKAVLFDETASLSYQAVLSSNNWGSAVNNPWFVTVGQGNSTTGGFGDFNGPGAIDLVLSTDFGYPTTVVVNPGTYTVNASGSGNYNFIGNEGGNSLPVFDLDVSTGTDEIGNKVLNCGRVLKSIKFQSNSLSTFHSVRPGATSGVSRSIQVRDCIFENVTLSVNDDAGLESSGILVEDCRFEQTGTFSDNACFLLPTANHVELRGCQVTGYGYAGLIGEDTGLSYSSGVRLASIAIRDCVFDQTGFTIDDASPFTEGGYLIVDESQSWLLIENTRVVADNALDPSATATIDSALAAAGQDRYVFLRSREIHIDHSLFHSPNQIYSLGGTSYPIIGLLLQPLEDLSLNNSRILSGGCPCQIGRDTDVMSNVRSGDISILNNTFMVESDARSNTALDIDLDPTVSTGDPRINIAHNKFKMVLGGAVTPAPPLHSATGASYDSHGIVQIFTDSLYLDFNNNLIDGALSANMPTGYAHVSGLVVNSAPSGTPSELNPVMIQSNEIRVTNSFSSVNVTDSASSANITGSTMLIENNFFGMFNGVGLSSSVITCLYLLSLSTAGGDPEPPLVTGNLFTRRRNSGATTDLKDGFVRIDGSSNRGVCHGNVFSDPTVDGSDETVFSDDSTSWASFNNTNEYYTVTTRGETGSLGLHDDTSGEDVYIMAGGSGLGANLDSAITVDVTSSSAPIIFGYQDTGDDVDFKWSIPLQSLVPNGATVTEVQVTVDVSINPTGASASAESRLRVIGSAGTSTDNQPSLNTSGHIHSLTGLSQRVLSGNYAYIELYSQITSDDALNYTASPLTIKYYL